jgi:hypothetical protein
MPLTASRAAGEAPTINRNDSTRNILPYVPRRTGPSPGAGVGYARAKSARGNATAARGSSRMRPFNHWRHFCS